MCDSDRSSSGSECDFLDVLEEACGLSASEADTGSGAQGLVDAVIPADQLPPPAAIPLGHTVPLTAAEENRHRIAKMEGWLAAMAARPECGSEAVAMHGVELRATAECGVGIFAAEKGPGLGPGHTALTLGRDCILSHQRALDGCVAYYDMAAILEAVRCPATTAVALFLVVQRALDLSPTRPRQDTGSTEQGARGTAASPASHRSRPSDGWVATLPGYSRLDCPIPSLCTPTPRASTGADARQDAYTESLPVIAAQDNLRRQVGAVLSYVEDELRGRATYAPFFPREVFSEKALTWAL